MADQQTHPARERKDFFLSYTGADRAWAEWIAWHLEAAGYQVVLQAWDFRPGTNFVQAMDRATREAERTLAVLSPAYVRSRFTPSEWQVAFRHDPTGEDGRLLPVLVEPFEVEGLLGNLVYLDLTNLDEHTARERLLAGVRRERARPPSAPAFPGARPLHAPGAAPPAFPGTLPPVWNVPFPRNPFFTGREAELHALHTQLAGGSTAISGLGGVGKTQLAVEYAYRHRQEYQAVLWVRADSVEALTASYSELARLLALPEQDAREQEVILGAVRRWLATQPGYLLILDNLDEPSVLVPPAAPDQPRPPSPFVPPTPAGHLLITTRAADLTALGLGLAHPLAMPVFEPEQGAALVLTRAGRPTAGEPEQALARQLSQELGGLALALEQAGAYLATSGISLADYLALFRTRSHELLSRHTGNDYPHAVATTWDLSFQRVQKRAPAAAELLRCCAFLAPDAIPEELLMGGARHLGKLLAPVAADPLRLSDALAALRASSLLTRDPEGRTLTVHRLVQQVLRARLAARERTQWMRRVVLAVEEAFPSVDFSAWPVCERLLPHALVCATWIEQVPIATPAAARLLNLTGSYLHDRGDYAQAEPLYRRALTIREQALGPLHPLTATSLNNLAELYHAQGKYAHAEPLYQRARTIREQALGPLHPDTATSLNNLAELYRAQGKYAQAEPLLQRALAILEQALGPLHPDTATSLNNLAELYHTQGDYAQAEPFLQRALAILEQALGPLHPDTATSLNNLAELYHTQGDYAQAEPLFQRALAIWEQALGPLHPDTAQSLNNLAMLYHAQGDYAQAEPLFQRALAIREQALGPLHPHTAQSLNNLAELYRAQGKYAQAEPLYQRALAISEQALGPLHHHTAHSLNNLAMLYHAQGKYAQAEPLLRRALAIREQALGPLHPLTAQSLNNLAELYHAQG